MFYTTHGIIRITYNTFFLSRIFSAKLSYTFAQPTTLERVAERASSPSQKFISRMNYERTSTWNSRPGLGVRFLVNKADCKLRYSRKNDLWLKVKTVDRGGRACKQEAGPGCIITRLPSTKRFHSISSICPGIV